MREALPLRVQRTLALNELVSAWRSFARGLGGLTTVPLALAGDGFLFVARAHAAELLLARANGERVSTDGTAVAVDAHRPDARCAQRLAAHVRARWVLKS